jgi:two-component system chemotaxis response regulator CheB
MNIDATRPPVHAPTYPLVAVGASTGGPGALATLLQGLPHDLPMSMIIVQHIPEALVPSLIETLSLKSKLPVQIAQSGTVLTPGTVHLSPGGRTNVLVTWADDRPTLLLEAAPKDQTYFPSVDLLCQSAARVFGSFTIGILLSGMGNDGTEGLKAIREAGGHTLAQDEESSVVFGMARHAIDAGHVETILPLDHMAKILWGQVLSSHEPRPSSRRKRTDQGVR